MNVYFDDNTNIRYHIFKELSKYRKFITKSSLDRINDFAVPVFAGLSTALLSQAIEQFFDIEDWWRILFYFFTPIVLYIAIYKVSKLTVYLYRYKYRPTKGNQIAKVENEIADIEERKAKFDYEVIKLMYASFTLILEGDDLVKKESENRKDDSILQEYYLMESVLHLSRALVKTSEVLLPYKIDIPTSRIQFVLKMASEIITLQRSNPFEGNYSENITSIIADYDRIIEAVNEMYSLKLNLYPELDV